MIFFLSVQLLQFHPYLEVLNPKLQHLDYLHRKDYSLRVFMATLRRKIEKDTTNPRFIITEVGVGYRFSEE